ncbi:uncharacterized protein LOC120906143 [Anopheles arabiensis]|uniref:Uncharacterized protein n=1 Tax=Anopheles arabiensis TaxID=7173 RepID=A0A182HIB9_ANOAR|nr:uncharacterized protein LOC120906143 [Anopheles arabiensis]
MAVSQLVEKLKFGDRYVLVNIVVKPVEDPPYSGTPVGFGFAERNKFLSSEIWHSFVYPKLREIFDQNLALIGENLDPTYEKDKDYFLKCVERPYLEMRVNFRDCAYRNRLNILFHEEERNLHHCCFYVEIRDQGRTFVKKIEDRDAFIHQLLDENKRMKAQIAALKSGAPTDATGVEGNDPKPVKKHVPDAPTVHPPLIKRTYKPSADSSQPGPSSAPDSYTMKVLCKFPTRQNSPSGPTFSLDAVSSTDSENSSTTFTRELPPRSSKPQEQGFFTETPDEQAYKMAGQKMADKRKQDALAGPSKTKSHKAKIATNNDQDEKKQEKPKVLDCTDMPESEILATFAGYRQELHEIFLKHKDELEEQWMANKELVYYTDVAHLFNEDQKMAMMQVLENEFVPIELNGKYTEFFTSTLLMEWIIRIFMKRYKFTTRQEALILIKKQEGEVLEYIARDW